MCSRRRRLACTTAIALSLAPHPHPHPRPQPDGRPEGTASGSVSSASTTRTISSSASSSHSGLTSSFLRTLGCAALQSLGGLAVDLGSPGHRPWPRHQHAGTRRRSRSTEPVLAAGRATLLLRLRELVIDFVGHSRHLADPHVEACRDLEERAISRVPNPSLDTPYMSPVDFRFGSKVFLAEFGLFARAFDGKAKRPQLGRARTQGSLGANISLPFCCPAPLGAAASRNSVP